MDNAYIEYIDMAFNLIKPLLGIYSGEQGPLAQFLTVVGTLRVTIPPIQNVLSLVVILTPTEIDNQIYNKIINSKIYKGFIYVLELLSSLKLKK